MNLLKLFKHQSDNKWQKRVESLIKRLRLAQTFNCDAVLRAKEGSTAIGDLADLLEEMAKKLDEKHL
jgi:hypothetical protein